MTNFLEVSNGGANNHYIEHNFKVIEEITRIHEFINSISNYPNPFNPTTNISLDIKEGETGRLTIFTMRGQIVDFQEFNSGKHVYPWNAEKSGSGLYIYQLKTESCIETKKMLLLK